ncbi:uncharacterized protein METZ01_LOCUS412727, partial [marine metagenome]
SGRIYHNVTLFQNAYTMNVQFSTFGSNNEIEIYTARHPWQAMNGYLDTFDGSAVNIQLEAYEEIDSITRIDYLNYRVEHTLHGLETGDVVEISGSHGGWAGQITGQEWEKEHVVTTLSSNTYVIVPATDYGSGLEQVMYDGNLYIQLEDQATGNNFISEDYTYTNYVVLDNTNGAAESPSSYDDVGASLLLEDQITNTPTVSTEGVLLFDAVEEFVATNIQVEAFTPSGFHTSQEYEDMYSRGSAMHRLAVEDAPEIVLEDASGNILLEDGAYNEF